MVKPLEDLHLSPDARLVTLDFLLWDNLERDVTFQRGLLCMCPERAARHRSGDADGAWEGERV